MNNLFDHNQTCIEQLRPSLHRSNLVEPTLGASLDGVRLVVSDMDGTLLDENGTVPPSFWPLLELLTALGIAFVAASGRQYPALVRLFSGRTEGISFIAENGTYVMQDDVEFSSAPLSGEYAQGFVAAVRRHADRGLDIGAVWCGRSCAYVERTDAGFLAQARRYYARLEVVEDLAQVQEDALKFALFVAGDPESPELADLRAECAPSQAVVSAAHWIDIMPPNINKGTALRTLQADLGINADETAVFGDYLNDLEMLDEAAHSFAMTNAHPLVLDRARYVAPSNADHGVLQVIAHLVEARQ